MDEDVNVPQSCILFATADWDEPYWTNKQHSAMSLAELGVSVLYVESVGLRSPKTGSSRDWKRLWNRLRKGLRSSLGGAVERAPGIYVLSPLVIPAGHRNPVFKWLNRYLLRWTINRSTIGWGSNTPLIWTYHPFMLDAIDINCAGALLYHCVDDLAAVPGVDAQEFREAETLLLKAADVVFVTAPALEERCSQLNSNTHYLPNVADVTHFGRALDDGPLPPELEAIPEPRLVYHGVLSDFKIDFSLLHDCARLRPEWQWVLIGEQREGQRSPLLEQLLALPNVHFLGYRPYERLPDYLRGMQVGLLPTLVNDYTRSMFPMKFYEYLAAGLPVVSTPLDFTRNPLPGLAIGRDPTEFIRAIQNQLGQGKLDSIAARTAVGTNTWHGRMESMMKLLPRKCA